MVEVNKVHVICNTADDKLIANIATNLARNLPEIEENKEPHGKAIAIIGGGPSLNDSHHAIPQGMDTMVCGTAYDHFIELGHVPTYAAQMDSKPVEVEYMQHKRDDVQYLIASQCAPELFDHLADCNVTMWHAANNLPMDAYGKDRDRILVVGPSNIGLRAVYLAIAMGYREFHLFGIDACLDTNAGYAYKHEDKVDGNPEIYTVMCNGETFHSYAWMIAQAQEFQQLLQDFGDNIRVLVYGDGLIGCIAGTQEQKIILTLSTEF